MLYQVTKQHKFLPEVNHLCFSPVVQMCVEAHVMRLEFISFLLVQAFTTEFRVHWGQHLLRPEFAESTYYLYKVNTGSSTLAWI